MRVFLVDDHVMLVDTLRRQFEADPAFQVVGTADSIASLCQSLDHNRPHIILLDIQLGSESGLDAIGHIRRALPSVRIVMVSMFDQAVYRDRAFALGADAYVTKGASFNALRQLLLCGEPGGGSTAGDQIWVKPRQSRLCRLTLTERELQVVQGLAGGKREKEVAEELNISISSVGTYLKRSMAKIGVETRAELFRHAGALGLEAVHEIAEEKAAEFRQKEMNEWI